LRPAWGGLAGLNGRSSYSPRPRPSSALPRPPSVVPTACAGARIPTDVRRLSTGSPPWLKTFRDVRARSVGCRQGRPARRHAPPGGGRALAGTPRAASAAALRNCSSSGDGRRAKAVKTTSTSRSSSPGGSAPRSASLRARRGPAALVLTAGRSRACGPSPPVNREAPQARAGT
jgi:hypothetical protein